MNTFLLRFRLFLVCISCLAVGSTVVLAQAPQKAITPLSYSPARAQSAHQMWHFGQVHPVSANRLVFNSGLVDLALMDARTGEYLLALDTVALYQYVEHYIDTSSHLALQIYKESNLKEDSISFTRYPVFETIFPIPGSTDLLVQTEVTYRPEAGRLYPWGVIPMMLRVDTALNIVSIKDLAQDWRPGFGERVDSTVDRKLIGVMSDERLIFYEPGFERADTTLRQYVLIEDRYVPFDESVSSGSLGQDIVSHFGMQLNHVLFSRPDVNPSKFLISTPSGKTLPLDSLRPEELAGHQFFDVDAVVGTNNVVLLTGEPDDRGYVASKTLSLFNVSTKKFVVLGTYAKATTKAHDVSIYEGIAYVLLYDDRRNRPLLHRVDLEEKKVFKM